MKNATKEAEDQCDKISKKVKQKCKEMEIQKKVR